MKTIHITLGAGDVAKIKIGSFITGSNESMAEKSIGWTLMGNGMGLFNLACLFSTSMED